MAEHHAKRAEVLLRASYDRASIRNILQSEFDDITPSIIAQALHAASRNIVYSNKDNPDKRRKKQRGKQNGEKNREAS